MEQPNFESALVECFLNNYNLMSGVFPTPEEVGASVQCVVQDIGFTLVSLPSDLQLVDDVRYYLLTIILPLKQPCAQIWVYNTLGILANCFALCVPSFLSGFVPNDSDCNLNPCLECDLVNLLPTFTRFVGRRRGLSGFLTGTVRKYKRTVTRFGLQLPLWFLVERIFSAGIDANKIDSKSYNVIHANIFLSSSFSCLSR
jgi:hypothetical protein